MKRTSFLLLLLLELVLSLTTLLAMSTPTLAESFTWTTMNALSPTHARHTVTLLSREKILVDGGHSKLAHAATIIISSCPSETTLRGDISGASPGDTIQFNISGACTITLTVGSIVINKNLTLDASVSPRPVTISGGGVVQVFQVNSGIIFTLNSLTIARGHASGSGGGLVNNGGTMNITNSTITGNTAGVGAGIENNGGTVNITNNSIITSNSTTGGSGGGIQDDHAGTVNISNSTITGNTAGVGGGLMNNSSITGSVTIINSTFSNNSATSGNGGGLENNNHSSGIVSIIGSTFSNNSATVGIGGGFSDDSGKVTITNSTFTGNSATGGSGGGGLANHDNVTITNSTFTGNSVTGGSGGGLANYSTMNIIGSTFSNNSVISGGTGGGLNNSSTVSITNSTIASNTAGGGFANAGGGKATLTNNTIATNTGGGIVGGGTVNIAQSIVANNSGSNCSFHPADYGYNLESGKDCGFSAGTGDLQNTNPQLASALANNGGPTSTLALLDSSPAIDKIPTSVCAVTTDQRGVSRPQGPACDIGAFESLVPSILTLTNDANTVVPGGPFTLSGSPITINFSFTSIVKDHLGNTQGWSLLAASSGITNGITTLDLNLTALNSSSTCINGTCTPVTFTAVSPLTTTPTPFLTAGNAGQTIVVTGDYTNVIGGQFTIPIGASAGVYTGFISVTLANVF